jgi:phosphate-induced protein 1
MPRDTSQNSGYAPLTLVRHASDGFISLFANMVVSVSCALIGQQGISTFGFQDASYRHACHQFRFSQRHQHYLSVLTSSDVAETSGFCSKYCGWRTHSTISGSDIKYSFVGNSYQCLNACAVQTVDPNGNAGVDGMVSVIAHELVN